VTEAWRGAGATGWFQLHTIEQNLGGLCVTESGESSRRPATGRRSSCFCLAWLNLLLLGHLGTVFLHVLYAHWTIAVAGREDARRV